MFVSAVAPPNPVMPLDETVFSFCFFDSAMFMNSINSANRSASLPAQLYKLWVAVEVALLIKDVTFCSSFLMYLC